ncbi:MAG: hypothetical protein ACXAD7_25830 [Candidatus Kariarchaeaceae archaeon]|jgi:predicted DNA-binding protein
MIQSHDAKQGKNITIRVTPDLKQRIKEFASTHKKKESTFIRDIIEDLLEEKTIILPLSIELKTKISELSQANNVSIADYIQKTLTNNIDKEEGDKTKELEARLNQLEEQSKFQLDGVESKFMMALGYVFSIDTGEPMHNILEKSVQKLQELGYQPETLEALSRNEREIVFTKLYDFFDITFMPSEVAYLIVESIFITYLSFMYPSPIFTITPFSMNIINRLQRLKKK